MSQTPNIFSPCSRLSSDVLREIFIHCSIGDHNPYGDYFLKNVSACFLVSGRSYFSIRKYPQLSISKVCSLWRDIALLTPHLWDNIYIDGFTEANLSTAREYLSRAGDLPVCITFGRCWTTEHRQDLRSQLTDFLSLYRIRTLEAPRFLVPDLPQRSVAELESLVIFGLFDKKEAQLDLNDTRYPKLAVFSISGLAYNISSFNSSSLRIFDVKRLSVTVIESWDLLSRCPSLEECRLWLIQDNDSRRPVSMPQIHLQRLRILDVDCWESEILFSTFIEVLTLPVVENLCVGGWSATAFESLAHRSNYFPHLRHFVLHVTPPAIVDARALLALNGLASGSLAPQLQILHVGYGISNTGSFLDMVESRWDNAQMSSNGVPARFTNVIFLASYLDDINQLRLRDMQQRGIPVRFHT